MSDASLRHLERVFHGTGTREDQAAFYAAQVRFGARCPHSNPMFTKNFEPVIAGVKLEVTCSECRAMASATVLESDVERVFRGLTHMARIDTDEVGDAIFWVYVADEPQLPPSREIWTGTTQWTTTLPVKS